MPRTVVDDTLVYFDDGYKKARYTIVDDDEEGYIISLYLPKEPKPTIIPVLEFKIYLVNHGRYSTIRPPKEVYETIEAMEVLDAMLKEPEEGDPDEQLNRAR